MSVLWTKKDKSIIAILLKYWPGVIAVLKLQLFGSLGHNELVGIVYVNSNLFTMLPTYLEIYKLLKQDTTLFNQWLTFP